MRFTVALALTTTVAVAAPAGVYHPLEPTPFPVTDGKTADLAFGSRFDGQFPVLFTRWGNVATETDNPDRKAVLARLATEASDPAAAGADLLRLNRAAEAVNRLMPLSRGRAPDGRVLFNLAHAHAVRGEWGEALSLHELAAEDGVPADLAGATADQRTWLTRVERDYYRRWLVEHRRRAATKSDPAAEEVFPLFPKDKPADAAAVVQQLLLWAPWDTALYWLLAEVYADSRAGAGGGHHPGPHRGEPAVQQPGETDEPAGRADGRRGQAAAREGRRAAAGGDAPAAGGRGEVPAQHGRGAGGGRRVRGFGFGHGRLAGAAVATAVSPACTRTVSRATTSSGTGFLLVSSRFRYGTSASRPAGAVV